MNEQIENCTRFLESLKGKPLTMKERSNRAIELAGLMLQAANQMETPEESKIQTELAGMMQDPNGKAFSIALVDQCFRSADPSRVADQLIYNLKLFGIPNYLNFFKRLQLRAFLLFGKLFPSLLVPLIKRVLRKQMSNVILPGESNPLIAYLKKRQLESTKINLNRLGEAILGEGEAQGRFALYLADLARPEVEYISVKGSTLFSQINLLAWDSNLEKMGKKLAMLYRAALHHRFTRSDGQSVAKFVNLDMEEYRDLNLTVSLFQQTLDHPEFLHLSAGIVLQSYLPDSFRIQQELTAWAQQRIALGGAPIKIRLVKGANLAIEKIDAALHGWPQATYLNKPEVDANFKQMLTFGCHPENINAVELGVGSHNLFDIAYALILASENNVEDKLCIEMLEGMAPHLGRVVKAMNKELLLYCPVVKNDELQTAIAYLIRRLDENTAPENFLRYSFGLTFGSEPWLEQAALFKNSADNSNKVDNSLQRTQDRFLELVKPDENVPFSNEPDTDWSLLQNRFWAEKIFFKWRNKKIEKIPLVIEGNQVHSNVIADGIDPSTNKVAYQYSLASLSDLDRALTCAKDAQKNWSAHSAIMRSHLLAEIAHQLRCHREDLIGSMILDTGKTMHEADNEVSEAIDFAEYYRRNLLDLDHLHEIKWHPLGTVVITPPWNFPCSIPAGCILAALAAGNCVIFKPAAESVLVGWTLVQLFWLAGVSPEVLQFVNCNDQFEGSWLIKDPRTDCVLLTGATSTAKLMMKMRPDLNLIAETGGKNTIIVSRMADRDLAVRDIIKSAFGHAGQKCSACSLVICEAEVYDDPKFRAQLYDAAASLQVGSAHDPSTSINPLIREPNPTLLRGLTILDPGEEWLLQPFQDPNNPNLWRPGIKIGVNKGNFTHQTELFGPVLGVMRAENLDHAIALANSTRYGLTAGLHSLDKREQLYWLERIEAGNLYVNRGITGAIVQRQPFGGWKESSFGPGAKAGGPNYLQQLMQPEQQSAVSSIKTKEQTRNKLFLRLSELLETTDMQEFIPVWNVSIESYVDYWNKYFCQWHDPSNLLGQHNFQVYRKRVDLNIRLQEKDSLIDLLRVLAAAQICQTSLVLSVDDPTWKKLPGQKLLTTLPDLKILIESDTQLVERLNQEQTERIRYLSIPPTEIRHSLGKIPCYVQIAPVLANGRIELLRYLREQSISIDTHRYGNIGPES